MCACKRNEYNINSERGVIFYRHKIKKIMSSGWLEIFNFAWKAYENYFMIKRVNSIKKYICQEQ